MSTDQHAVPGEAELARMSPEEKAAAGMAADHVAQVVGIRPVGQHVRDLEFVAAFRVRIAGHDHDDLAPAQIVGAGSAAIDTFDPP